MTFTKYLVANFNPASIRNETVRHPQNVDLVWIKHALSST
jgi:hypothetical protein